MLRVLVLLLISVCVVTFASDNSQLKALYDADQSARKEMENGGRVPSIDEDLERRNVIFELLVEGKIRSAEDYIRALIILQHTSLWVYGEDATLSMSPENHLLAFHMARRGHELGHELGAHFLVWTYNYYLRGVGCDIETYGFDLVNGRIVPYDGNISAEVRASTCRYFDPVPTYRSLNLYDEP